MHFPQWGWEESVEQELIPHKVLKESEPPAVTMIFGAGQGPNHNREEKRSNTARAGANVLNLIDSSVFFEVSEVRNEIAGEMVVCHTSKERSEAQH